MKISNSKKQLAKIINENGGWREGAEFAAQGGRRGNVGFTSVRPVREGLVWDMTVGFAGSFLADAVLPNWHQTILSRDEYFYLYPAQVKVVVENKTTCTLTVTDGPSIEHLAADYRNAKDYAERKQQEADAAKGDAEARLAAYVAAEGSAVGLVLSVGAPEPKPELVITDWRDLQVGDEVGCIERPCGAECLPGMTGVVARVSAGGVYAKFASAVRDGRDVWFSTDGAAFTFIRRPAKEAPDA